MNNRTYFTSRSYSKSLLIVICSLSVLLSGCVTTTTGPVTKPDPKKSLASNIQLGIGYIRNGEYDRAKEKIAKALEIDPSSAEAYNAYGLLFQVQGEVELAEKNYKKAIRFDPEFTAARNNFGAFLYSQQRYAEAAREFEKASENIFYKARNQVFENLGICYLKMNDPIKAEQYLIRATQLNPKQPRALLELSSLEFNRRDYVKADAHYQRYVQVSRQSARSLWLGIQIARIFERKDIIASYSLMLKNIFPASEEYKQFVASLP